MAVWESRKQVSRWWNKITQVSWTDWTAMDVYYWMEHSFQYAKNINTDDEMHWIKLSTKAESTTNFKKCQLVSAWKHWVVALPVDDWLWTPSWFDHTTFSSWWSSAWTRTKWDSKVCPWVVFQDYFWYAWYSAWGEAALIAVNVANHNDIYVCVPKDHLESTDESIMDKDNVLAWMTGWVTAILNYNNSRLIVACWSDIWVYYPELDLNNPIIHPTAWLVGAWKTWWKKTLTYEAWVEIVWLTCSFEYLKVWAVDEWWDTKVYYYQGNNNLRDTFVYNVVDLSWVRVLRVYSINGIDYYVSSLDWTDWFVNLYKLVWSTPVHLFKQRAWLDPLDVNYKAPYFVWPTSISAAYNWWKFYIADAYWLFQFTYNPQGFDPWYMKWWLYNNEQVYWVCENQWYLYVSTATHCYIMRILDTWKPPLNGGTDWYQSEGVLISREYEWNEGWTITKMLDEIRLNYEMNPNTNSNWTIDVYVSPNNLWKTTSSFTEANWWYHVMHLSQTNAWTRTEKSNTLNNLWSWDTSSFAFDWQTITYAIVITRWSERKATPIVRQIDLKYHCKDKVNNVYDIN